MGENLYGLPPDILAAMAAEASIQKSKKTKDFVYASSNIMLSMDSFIQSDQRPPNFYQESEFSKPEAMLKSPTPGCMYVWKVPEVSKGGLRGDAQRVSMLIHGLNNNDYRIVEMDELKDYTDVAVMPLSVSLDSSTGVDAVSVRGFIMVEVQPHAVLRDYRGREIKAGHLMNPEMGMNHFQNLAPNMAGHVEVIQNT
jgi:hypothetical protein